MNLPGLCCNCLETLLRIGRLAANPAHFLWSDSHGSKRWENVMIHEWYTLTLIPQCSERLRAHMKGKGLCFPMKWQYLCLRWDESSHWGNVTNSWWKSPVSSCGCRCDDKNSGFWRIASNSEAPVSVASELRASLILRVVDIGLLFLQCCT